jgi:carbon monoxide dehydrogenase subunit G
MEVKLDKRYPLEVDADRAWQVLRSVNSVAGCMPGAAITEQIDDTHYKGTVKVKVGPTTAAFAGDIEVRALDEGAKRVVLFGKGADRGGSSASMELTATVEPVAVDPSKCDLVGQADVIVNGKFAQFGGRMMVQVSDMILAQFADNFRATAAALPAPAAVAAPATEVAASAGAEPAAVTEAAPVAAPAPAAPPKLNKDLNAFAIVWMLIKNWFASLFGRRPA